MAALASTVLLTAAELIKEWHFSGQSQVDPGMNVHKARPQERAAPKYLNGVLINQGAVSGAVLWQLGNLVSRM